GDRVGLERTRWILADCATAKRDDRGERIIQRTGHRSLVRATASHDEVLVKRVTRDAKALLQIGYLRLRLERALRRVHDGEDAAGDGEHDAHRDDHFQDRKTVFAPHQLAFRVFTLIIRAS